MNNGALSISPYFLPNVNGFGISMDQLCVSNKKQYVTQNQPCYRSSARGFPDGCESTGVAGRKKSECSVADYSKSGKTYKNLMNYATAHKTIYLPSHDGNAGNRLLNRTLLVDKK
jgi:hypothetical protein